MSSNTVLFLIVKQTGILIEEEKIIAAYSIKRYRKAKEIGFKLKIKTNPKAKR